jgi:hypothetical protein
MRSFVAERYFELLLGIALYFVLSSVRINRERAGWYVGLYFLSALAGMAAHQQAVGWPILFGMPFPAENGLVAAAAAGLLCFLLAKYGARGVLDLAKPWRLLLIALAFVGCIYSGYRVQIIVVGLVFAALFCIEGLFRTRHLATVLAAGALALAVLIPNARHLPFAAQRALSFLPVEVEPSVRYNNEVARKWRVETWKSLVPKLPGYLLKGKGYAIDPTDLHLASDAMWRGLGSSHSLAEIAGDYHNGPLSVVVPFGIPGVIAFLWFLTAAGIALYRNYALGAPELRIINRLLLAVFCARVFCFVFLFGSLYAGMAFFCGLLGLAMSLNGGAPEPQLAGAREPAPGPTPDLLQEDLSARLV